MEKCLAIDWTNCVGFAYLLSTKWCWTKSDIQGAPNTEVPYISGYRCDFEPAEESLVGRDPDGFYPDLQETTTPAVRVKFMSKIIRNNIFPSVLFLNDLEMLKIVSDLIHG